MYDQPKKVCLVWGAAEGDSDLTAFDNALRKAGIGDLNLIRVSSIVPPNAQLSPLPDIPFGTLTPTVYARASSDVAGRTVAACVAAGYTERGGVLMEVSGAFTAEEAEERARAMVAEGMGVRGLEPYELHLATAEHTVERIGCAVAAAVLWRG